MLDSCNTLGIAFIAFSPLARGFLTGEVTEPSALIDGDIRKGMPRFQSPHFEQNKTLLNIVREISNQANCSLAQVNLAWLLHQGDNILPIPGTTQTTHLRDNIGATDINLTREQLSTLDKAFMPEAISGRRYPLPTQKEIDTEEF